MKYIFAIIFALLPLPVFAEIEKIAITGDAGMALHWWPKISAPEGWHQDKNMSLNYSSNSFAPDGFTFANAETVMYASALYKPREPSITSIEQLIENDKKTFLSHSPTIKIEEVDSLITADKTVLRSLVFTPKENGNWERISYKEEGDFYLIFVISSRSLEGYQTNEAAYIAFVGSYKE